MSRKKKQQQTETEAETAAATATATGGFGDAGPPPPPANRITPIDIQQKVFRSSVRGYHEREVDQFLDEVTEELARLLAESRSLREQLERAEMRPTARFGSETEGAAAIEEARAQATRTLSEAREQAAGIVAEARGEAVAILEAAEAQAGTGRPPGWDAAGAGATAAAAAAGASGRMPDRDFIHREREFLQSMASLIQDHAEAIREDLRRVRGEPEPEPEAGTGEDEEREPPGKHVAPATPISAEAVAEAEPAQPEPQHPAPSDSGMPEETATPLQSAAAVAVAAQVVDHGADGGQEAGVDATAPEGTTPDGTGAIQDEPEGTDAEPDGFGDTEAQSEPETALEGADDGGARSVDPGEGAGAVGPASIAGTPQDGPTTDASVELTDIAGGYASDVAQDEDEAAAWRGAPQDEPRDESQDVDLDLSAEAGDDQARGIPAAGSQDDAGTADVVSAPPTVAPAHGGAPSPSAEATRDDGDQREAGDDAAPEPAGVGVGRPRSENELSAHDSADQPRGPATGPTGWMPDRGDDTDEDEADRRSLRELFWGED
jgi:cell division initiation protein